MAAGLFKFIEWYYQLSLFKKNKLLRFIIQPL